MNTYAVALISYLSDEGLQHKVVTAESWSLALDEAFPGYLENLKSRDQREAKIEALNQDWEFDVLEVARYGNREVG